MNPLPWLNGTPVDPEPDSTPITEDHNWLIDESIDWPPIDQQLEDRIIQLLHPVRLRIVHAMSGGRTRTTSELCARLPDVPKTTVYRHVGVLTDAGLLEVADEQRVHGAVERHYRLHPERTAIDADAAAAMAALLAEFNAYLDRDGADPTADSVGYRQGTLWLSPDELAELISALRAVLATRAQNEPAPGRNPHLLSMILFPTEEPSQH
ncbi:helix-turn-helix domain-containing protein [Saccharopolyspora sp. 5N708]|uniref:helix-turn-helix domain-containing protein n=1 Tax=Saccharopolyspora sp. 5N708 TaxID=3457424 RepID=UPI003FD2FB3C